MLIDSFTQHLSKKSFFKKDDRLLIAFSGGVDSVVLADLLIKLGYDVSIAHMNFQLRGHESDLDEGFVRQYAKTNNIKSFVKKVEIEKGKSASEGSIQMQARTLRYDWFNKIRNKHGFDYVLTAHHLDDSIETFFNNLLRGSGINGLTGISEARDFYRRPLLIFTKHELTSYAKDAALRWREDESNKSTKYQRNYLRHEIIPKLKSLQPSFYQTMHDNFERLHFAYDYYKKQLHHLEDRYCERDGPILKINKEIEKEFQFKFLLYEILKKYGFTSEQLSAFHYKSVGASLMSGTYQLINDRDFLLLSPKSDATQRGFYQLISTFPAEVKFKNTRYSFRVVDKSEVNFNHKNVEYLSLDACELPWTIRLWKQGDKFQPLGMRGKQKISDILIDEKVPLSKKDEKLVLEDQNGIILLFNHKLAERVKITADTTNIIRIDYHGNL